MTKVLVDTSILVEFLRYKKKKTAYEKLLETNCQPVVSFITPAELWAGKSVWESKEKAKALETVLSGVETVFPRQSTLILAGKLRAKYNISLPDALIAACAVERKLPLLTLNLKELGKVREIKLFKIKR